MKIDISRMELGDIISGAIKEAMKASKLVPAVVEGRALDDKPAPEARHIWAYETTTRILAQIDAYEIVPP
jgi:hypothetical protein